MAREFGKVVCAIWRDEDFTALSGEAQRVFLMLVSQPQLSFAGHLPYTPTRWARFTGDATTGSVETALEELEDARFVVIDRDTEELVLRTFVRHDQIDRQPNLVPAMWKAWDEIVSDRLRAVVVSEAPEGVFTQEKYPPPKAADTLRATLPEPIGEPFPEGIPEPVEMASATTTPSPSNHNSLAADAAQEPVDNGERRTIKQALIDALGRTPTTESEQGAWRKAAKEIHEAGATPDLVHLAVAAYRRKWPDMACTPNALSKHWGDLIELPGPVSEYHGPALVARCEACDRLTMDCTCETATPMPAGLLGRGLSHASDPPAVVVGQGAS